MGLCFPEMTDTAAYENPQTMLRPVYSRFDYYLCKAFFDIRCAVLLATSALKLADRSERTNSSTSSSTSLIRWPRWRT